MGGGEEDGGKEDKLGVQDQLSWVQGAFAKRLHGGVSNFSMRRV